MQAKAKQICQPLQVAVGFRAPLQVLPSDPAYDVNGELMDAGDDLTMGGTCEYLHDGIYLTAFVQILSPFLSDWLWLVFLVD